MAWFWDEGIPVDEDLPEAVAVGLNPPAEPLGIAARLWEAGESVDGPDEVFSGWQSSPSESFFDAESTQLGSEELSPESPVGIAAQLWEAGEPEQPIAPGSSEAAEESPVLGARARIPDIPERKQVVEIPEARGWERVVSVPERIGQGISDWRKSLDERKPFESIPEALSQTYFDSARLQASVAGPLVSTLLEAPAELTRRTIGAAIDLGALPVVDARLSPEERFLRGVISAIPIGQAFNIGSTLAAAGKTGAMEAIQRGVPMHEVFLEAASAIGERIAQAWNSPTAVKFEEGKPFTAVAERAGIYIPGSIDTSIPSDSPVLAGLEYKLPVGDLPDYLISMALDPLNYVGTGIFRGLKIGSASLGIIDDIADAPFRALAKVARNEKIAGAGLLGGVGVFALDQAGQRLTDKEGNPVLPSPTRAILGGLPSDWQTAGGLMVPIAVGLGSAMLFRGVNAGVGKAFRTAAIAVGDEIVRIPTDGMPIVDSRLRKNENGAIVDQSGARVSNAREARPGELIQAPAALDSLGVRGVANLVSDSVETLTRALLTFTDNDQQIFLVGLAKLTDAVNASPEILRSPEKLAEAYNKGASSSLPVDRDFVPSEVFFDRKSRIAVTQIADSFSEIFGPNPPLYEKMKDVLLTVARKDGMTSNDILQRLSDVVTYKIQRDLGIKNPLWDSPLRRYASLVSELEFNTAAKDILVKNGIDEKWLDISSDEYLKVTKVMSVHNIQSQRQFARGEATAAKRLSEIEAAWEKAGKQVEGIRKPNAIDQSLIGSNINPWLDLMMTSKIVFAPFQLFARPEYTTNNIASDVLLSIALTMQYGVLPRARYVKIADQLGLDRTSWAMDRARSGLTQDVLGRPQPTERVPPAQGVVRRSLRRFSETSAFGHVAGKVATFPVRAITNLYEVATRKGFLNETNRRDILASTAAVAAFKRDFLERSTKSYVQLGLDERTASKQALREYNALISGSPRQHWSNAIDWDKIPAMFREQAQELAKNSKTSADFLYAFSRHVIDLSERLTNSARSLAPVEASELVKRLHSIYDPNAQFVSKPPSRPSRGKGNKGKPPKPSRPDDSGKASRSGEEEIPLDRPMDESGQAPPQSGPDESTGSSQPPKPVDEIAPEKSPDAAETPKSGEEAKADEAPKTGEEARAESPGTAADDVKQEAVQESPNIEEVEESTKPAKSSKPDSNIPEDIPEYLHSAYLALVSGSEKHQVSQGIARASVIARYHLDKAFFEKWKSDIPEGIGLESIETRRADSLDQVATGGHVKAWATVAPDNRFIEFYAPESSVTTPFHEAYHLYRNIAEMNPDSRLAKVFEQLDSVLGQNSVEHQAQLFERYVIEVRNSPYIYQTNLQTAKNLLFNAGAPAHVPIPAPVRFLFDKLVISNRVFTFDPMPKLERAHAIWNSVASTLKRAMDIDETKDSLKPQVQRAVLDSVAQALGIPIRDIREQLEIKTSSAMVDFLKKYQANKNDPQVRVLVAAINALAKMLDRYLVFPLPHTSVGSAKRRRPVAVLNQEDASRAISLLKSGDVDQYVVFASMNDRKYFVQQEGYKLFEKELGQTSYEFSLKPERDATEQYLNKIGDILGTFIGLGPVSFTDAESLTVMFSAPSGVTAKTPYQLRQRPSLKFNGPDPTWLDNLQEPFEKAMERGRYLVKQGILDTAALRSASVAQGPMVLSLQSRLLALGDAIAKLPKWIRSDPDRLAGAVHAALAPISKENLLKSPEVELALALGPDPLSYKDALAGKKAKIPSISKATAQDIINVAEAYKRYLEEHSAFVKAQQAILESIGADSVPLDESVIREALKRIPDPLNPIWVTEDGAAYKGPDPIFTNDGWKSPDGQPVFFLNSLEWAAERAPDAGWAFRKAASDAIAVVESQIRQAMTTPEGLPLLEPSEVRRIHKESAAVAAPEGVRRAREHLFGYDDRTIGQELIDHFSPYSYWTMNMIGLVGPYFAKRPGQFYTLMQIMRDWAAQNEGESLSDMFTIFLWRAPDGTEVRLRPLNMLFPFGQSIGEFLNPFGGADERGWARILRSLIQSAGAAPYVPIELALQAATTYGAGALTDWWTGPKKDQRAQTFTTQGLIINRVVRAVTGVDFDPMKPVRQLIYGDPTLPIERYYTALAIAKMADEGKISVAQAKRALLDAMEGKPNRIWEQASRESGGEQAIFRLIRYFGLPLDVNLGHILKGRRLQDMYFGGKKAEPPEGLRTMFDRAKFLKDNPGLLVRWAMNDAPDELRRSVLIDEATERFRSAVEALNERLKRGEISGRQWEQEISKLRDERNKARAEAGERAESDEPQRSSDRPRFQPAEKWAVDEYFKILENVSDPKKRDEEIKRFLDGLDTGTREAVLAYVYRNESDIERYYRTMIRPLMDSYYSIPLYKTGTQQQQERWEKAFQTFFKAYNEHLDKNPNDKRGASAAGQAALRSAGLTQKDLDEATTYRLKDRSEWLKKPEAALLSQWWKDPNERAKEQTSSSGTSGKPSGSGSASTGTAGGTGGAVSVRTFFADNSEYRKLSQSNDPVDRAQARLLLAQNWDALVRGGWKPTGEKIDVSKARLELERASILKTMPQGNASAYNRWLVDNAKRLNELNASLGNNRRYPEYTKAQLDLVDLYYATPSNQRAALLRDNPLVQQALEAYRLQRGWNPPAGSQLRPPASPLPQTGGRAGGGSGGGGGGGGAPRQAPGGSTRPAPSQPAQRTIRDLIDEEPTIAREILENRISSRLVLQLLRRRYPLGVPLSASLDEWIATVRALLEQELALTTGGMV